MRLTTMDELLSRLRVTLVQEHPVAFQVLTPGIIGTERGHATVRRYCGTGAAGWHPAATSPQAR